MAPKARRGEAQPAAQAQVAHPEPHSPAGGQAAPPPWELARQDPTDLPAAEVTLSIAIEASFFPKAKGATVSYKWFTATGQELVDAGPLSGWEVAPDETRRDALTSAEADAAAARLQATLKPSKPGKPGTADKQKPGSAGKQGQQVADGGEEREPKLVNACFQKAAAPLKITCAMARQIAEFSVEVHIKLPASDPSASSGSQGFADELQLVVPLQLAPMLLPRADGGEPEIATRLSTAEATNRGLTSFHVGVRCSTNLLSEEIKAHLNPMMLTLDRASKLPCDDAVATQARDRVYATLNAFGQQLRSAPCKLDSGKANFHHQTVFFVGTWPAKEFQDYLRRNVMTLQVHDRDEEGFEGQQSIKPGRSGKLGKEEKPPEPQEAQGLATAVAERRRDREAQAIGVYGSASLSLAALLGKDRDRLKPGQAYRLRTPLAPEIIGNGRREPGATSAVSNCSVAELFSDRGAEALASRKERRRRLAPGYALAGSAVAVDVRLALPDKAPWLPVAEESEADGQQREQPRVQFKTTPNVEKEPFSRVVVAHSRRDGATIQPLLGLVTDQNVAALGLDEGQRDFLSGVVLTEEQSSDPELDILTGFVISDRTWRVIVVEGLRHGAMKKVAEVLQVGDVNEPGRRVLFSTAVGFADRLYGPLGAALKIMKLRQPMLEELTIRPDLCLNNSNDEAAEALMNLAEMRRAERLHALIGHFPTAHAVLAVETRYGTFVSDEELAGGNVGTSRATSAVSRGSARRTGSRVQSRASTQKSAVAFADKTTVSPLRAKASKTETSEPSWSYNTKVLDSRAPALLVPMTGGEPSYSFNVVEHYISHPGCSKYLDSYMKEVARPIAEPSKLPKLMKRLSHDKAREAVATAATVLPGSASTGMTASSGMWSARNTRTQRVADQSVASGSQSARTRCAPG